VDGPAFRDLLNAGLAWLDRHHEIVNALNVFPVPDGDTGTNMLLTMRSACQEIEAQDSWTVGEVAKAAAQGALMGARGNSGVILSQIFRGMARELEAQSVLTGPAFAEALTEGSRIAYRGVSRPVEGTILTVVREAAEAARNAAEVDPDLRFVMARALKAADEAVANTPNLLPVLAQAGKVDSGGKGLYFILEGMYRALLGEVLIAPPLRAEAPAVPAPPQARPIKGQRELPPLVYGFDVQFLVEGRGLDVEAIRQRITAMGECGLVEGNENLVKVHVHVRDPGVVLSYAVSLGFVTDVIVENMDDMYIPEMPRGYDPLPPRFAGPERAAAVPPTLPAKGTGQAAVAPLPAVPPIEGPGIIAVVSGAGLAEVFKSLGTHIVVSGGQTMNPSTQELLAAVEQLPAQEVIILPNNGNIIMAAQQAQALGASAGPSGQPKSVAVVPSRSIPQGISALLAYNPQQNLARNVERMTAALDNVQTGEVTVAVQDAHFNGIEIKAGDVIGLLNDTLTAKGSSSEEVVLKLLEQMGAAELEVITLYYGQPVSPEEAERLRARLNELFPNQEIELINGGQPFYHYIISAE
jgi:DAK2 domain fusion protein YloV